MTTTNLDALTTRSAAHPGCVPDSPFCRDLPPAWVDFFERMPKAELHCHLLGTITRETFSNLVKASRAPITEEQINAWYTRGEKPVGVLAIFRALETHVLKDPEMLYRITLEHMQTLSRQNVRYVEFFWNWTGLQHFFSYRAGQDAIVHGLIDGERLHGVKGLLIPSIDRENTPEAAVELVENMVANRHPLVGGLGIDYRETNHEPENFWRAYDLARRHGLKLTAHAGEFGEHWRNIQTSVELLGCTRIDHGYTIVDNEALAQKYIDLGIPFSVVPTNSYYLRTLEPSKWAIEHPIRKMAAMGIKLFPNSDDPAMHLVSISQAYRLMFDFLGFELSDIRQMMLNSIEAAWVDEAYKARWRQEWAEEFDALASQLPPLAPRR